MTHGDISLQVINNGGLVAAELYTIQNGSVEKVQRLSSNGVESSDSKCSLSGNGEDEIV